MVAGDQERVRVLVLCGDRWHRPETARRGLEQLHDEAFAFDWIENAGEWSAERMTHYPVVIMTKSNNTAVDDERPWMTPAVEHAFRDYVRSGKGLLVIHSGSAGYAETPVLRALTGGTFLKHPAQCPVTIGPREGHPLTTGSTAFTVVDEHYMMALDDTSADVFLTTASEHGTEPGGWTRREGNGRVCLLSPGHNVEVWLHPSFQALLRNALQWCGNGG